MTKKALTLSIIIPVYNEELRLEACLSAIARQTVKPDEVIVVDNNSKDGSVKLAKSYDFVRVIHERQQGLTYARNAGLNAARSDILARIDADAILATDWVERVKKSFADPQLTGVTGLGSTDCLPRLHRPKTVIFSWLYFLWAKGIFRLPVLWGANMAIRRSAWQQIKSEVTMDGAVVHEDEDISLCILEHGGHLEKDNKLRITTDGQTYHYLPKLTKYVWLMYNTKRIHRDRPSFQRLRRSPPWLFMAFLWCTVGLVLIPAFFAASLLLFPLDWTMHHVKGSRTWLN